MFGKKRREIARLTAAYEELHAFLKTEHDQVVLYRGTLEAIADEGLRRPKNGCGSFPTPDAVRLAQNAEMTLQYLWGDGFHDDDPAWARRALQAGIRIDDCTTPKIGVNNFIRHP